ncbi:MAG: hypothetical protein SOU51_02795 [Collinsella sp.]|nr:hypothetical protein [Collinsella sp.]
MIEEKNMIQGEEAPRVQQELRSKCAEYTALDHVYRSEVLIPGYGSVAFVLLGLALLVPDITYLGALAPLAKVAGVVMVLGGLYTIQRTFVAHAYPRVIRLDEKGIEFESFGSSVRFETDRLTRCAVREGARGRSFLRIEQEGGPTRRLFLNCMGMEGADGERAMAVQDYLFVQEARLDPKSIRVRARKLNERKEEGRRS